MTPVDAPIDQIDLERQGARLAAMLGGFAPTPFRLAEQQLLPNALPATRVERLERVSSSGEHVRAFLARANGQETAADRPISLL